MSIHENLPPQARKELKKVGWAKGLELAKLARRNRQSFNCAMWLHKARELPEKDFQRKRRSRNSSNDFSLFCEDRSKVSAKSQVA